MIWWKHVVKTVQSKIQKGGEIWLTFTYNAYNAPLKLLEDLKMQMPFFLHFNFIHTQDNPLIRLLVLFPTTHESL